MLGAPMRLAFGFQSFRNLQKLKKILVRLRFANIGWGYIAGSILDTSDASGIEVVTCSAARDCVGRTVSGSAAVDSDASLSCFSGKQGSVPRSAT